MAGRAAIIGAVTWAVVLGGAILLRADELPAPSVPPAPGHSPDNGWPHTARQQGFPPPPFGGRPSDPYAEPPLSPFLPQKPIEPDVLLPEGSSVTLPAASKQLIRFSPRYERLPNYVLDKLPDDTQRLLYTGGVIVNVIYPGAPGAGVQEVEFATDTAVIWVKGADGKNPTSGLETGSKSKIEVELYLAGDVVIRSLGAGGPKGKPVEQVLRSEEIYYDVNKSRAIAMAADLEMKGVGVPDSVHVKGSEVWRLGKNEWRAFDSLTYSSKRPADPNLTVRAKQSTLLQQEMVRRNIFGRPYRDLSTGEQSYGTQRTLINEKSTVRILNVPIFYSRKSETDLAEPFGPLAGIALGNSSIFGFQFYSTWDMYKLLAVEPPVGHRWLLDLDYLSLRGPGFGTNYNYSGQDFLGFGGPQLGQFKAYGIVDNAEEDVLGAYRGPQPEKPDFRGRLQWWHNQELYERGTKWARTQAQIDYLSDKNFLEQYYKLEFDSSPNQETFWYANGADGNLWGSVWVEGNLSRDWVTETNWLPRADGAWIGKSFLNDRLVYSARGSAGYAQLRPTVIEPYAVEPTDQKVDTGRFDVRQRLSVPFDLGPLRLDPYGVMELTQYTEDLTGDARGRFYGGGGLAASLSASKVYSEANSELFNVKGLNHKVTLGGNYFASHSDTPYTQLPQLDRIFDDSLDQAFRNYRPIQSQMIPGPGGVALQNSPLYDPQQYAIRRMITTHPDTLDGLQEFQIDLRQRLQTKRGFTGSEHIVDWMSLDLSATYFPDPATDNYGQSWSFLEYAYIWHMGDRFSFSSAGWMDPIENGPRYFNLGFNFNRPDGTNFYLAYRHTDPVNSRALTLVVNYQLSSKYSVNVASAYDFGLNEALTNNVNFARTGTDMTVMFGFTYNALVNNFGIQFAVVPNVTGYTPGQFQSANSMLNAGRR